MKDIGGCSRLSKDDAMGGWNSGEHGWSEGRFPGWR